MQATKTETELTPKQETRQPEGCAGAKPQAEHEWLQRIVGEWTGEGEASMAPGQPPVKWKSTEIVRSIGGMWVVGEGTGDTPGGGTATTIITLGYDPKKSKYVGTFIGSMMNNLWIYEGSLDAGANVLTLDTEGPAMSPEPAMAKYKDVVEFKSNDHRTLTSFIQGTDGQWQQIMTANYHRTK